MSALLRLLATWFRPDPAHYRQRIVLAWERPTIMRVHIYTGAMGNIYFWTVSGVFFAQFARAVGTSVFQFGLVSAFASLALSMQVFSARIVDRLGHRKALWMASAMSSRVLRMAGLAIAYLLWRATGGTPWAADLLIAFTILSAFLGAFADPPWLSWLADLIPQEEHSTFWGRRSAFIALAVVLTIMPLALGLDRLRDEDKVNGLMGLFLFGSALGVLDLVIHRTIPEPYMRPVRQRPLLQSLLAPLRHRRFRRWLIFISAWNFGMMISAPVVWIYFVEDLRMSRSLFGASLVTLALPLIGTVFTGRVFGAWIDRVGTRRALFFSHVFWSMLPAVWFWATPELGFFSVGLAAIVGGTFSNCANNAATKIVTRVPPPSRRTMFIAVSACVASLAAALGAFAGGTLAGALEHVRLHWALGQVRGFHIVFALSFLLRLSAAFLAWIVPDPSEENKPGQP